jgi:hypothetical protein
MWVERSTLWRRLCVLDQGLWGTWREAVGRCHRAVH